MSIQPLLESTWVIQVHAFGAMAGFLLGVIQFVAPKGTLPHKAIGFVWILILSTVGVSSIFIRPSIAPGLPIAQWFSWIHIFTLLTFWAVIEGSYLLIRGGPALKRHANAFRGLFIGGLVIAGGFAFLPGRTMHEVVFGG